jgi:methionine sulfoxide reductase heme-binding subunit
MTGQSASARQQGRPTAPLPLGKFFLTTIVICILITALWAVLRLTPILDTAKAVMSVYNPKLAWYFSRASGIVSYLMLTISVVWGLILSTKISKEYTPAPAVLALHNAVGWIAVGIGAMHGFSLMFDTYFTYDLFDILIPFNGPYKPFWVGLGTLSLYIMLVASASFAWKDWLGQRAWRMMHYCTFGMYGMVTLHGLMTGTDSWITGTNLMYVGSVLVVLFLTNYRVIAGKEAAAAAWRSSTPTEQSARPHTPAYTVPVATNMPENVSAPRTSRSTDPEAEARRAAAKERAVARRAEAPSTAPAPAAVTQQPTATAVSRRTDPEAEERRAAAKARAEARQASASAD